MPNWANLLGPMASTRSESLYIYTLRFIRWVIYKPSNSILLINLHQVASASKFYDLWNQKP